jgi:hypothetical protein
MRFALIANPQIQDLENVSLLANLLTLAIAVCGYKKQRYTVVKFFSLFCIQKRILIVKKLTVKSKSVWRSRAVKIRNILLEPELQNYTAPALSTSDVQHK